MDPAPSANGRRVGAAVIDFLIVLVAFVLWGIAFGDSHAGSGNASVNVTGFPAVAFFVLALLYFAITETATGGTPGKWMLGVEVVRVDGSRVGFGRSLGRNVLRVVDWLPVGYIVGLISMVVTDDSQRIGDLAAKTTVRRRAARR